MQPGSNLAGTYYAVSGALPANPVASNQAASLSGLCTFTFRTSTFEELREISPLIFLPTSPSESLQHTNHCNFIAFTDKFNIRRHSCEIKNSTWDYRQPCRITHMEVRFPAVILACSWSRIQTLAPAASAQYLLTMGSQAALTALLRALRHSRAQLVPQALHRLVCLPAWPPVWPQAWPRAWLLRRV